MANNFDDDSASDPPRAISRRSTLEYFNPAAATSRLRRMFGAREKMYEGLKTLAWVVPLTILIWIYAERQQLVQNPVVVPGVGIKPVWNDQRRTVQINGSDEPTITLRLTGPQEGVRRVIDELTQHIPRPKLLLVVGANQPDGDNVSINVVDSIQNQDLFKNNGVSVQEAQPALMSLNIDTLDHRNVEVLSPPDRPDLSATRIDPSKVTVSGPRRVLSAVYARGDLKAYLRLDGFSQLKNPSPGSYPLQSVPIDIPASGRLHVDPNHVDDATLLVAQSDVTYEIPDPVYLWIDARPVTLDKYSILPSDGVESIPKVQVRGPKDAIEKLRTMEFIPKARLEISADDVANKTSVVPKFDLPPGVEVISEGSKNPIKFAATALH